MSVWVLLLHLAAGPEWPDATVYMGVFASEAGCNAVAHAQPASVAPHMECLPERVAP